MLFSRKSLPKRNSASPWVIAFACAKEKSGGIAFDEVHFRANDYSTNGQYFTCNAIISRVKCGGNFGPLRRVKWMTIKRAFFPALNKHLVKSIEKVVNVMLNPRNFLFEFQRHLSRKAIKTTWMKCEIHTPNVDNKGRLAMSYANKLHINILCCRLLPTEDGSTILAHPFPYTCCYAVAFCLGKCMKSSL